MVAKLHGVKLMKIKSMKTRKTILFTGNGVKLSFLEIHAAIFYALSLEH